MLYIGYLIIVNGQNRTIHWGIIFCAEMMILRGVRCLIPYHGVCYANDPKKGGGVGTRPKRGGGEYDACTCARSHNPFSR